MRHDELIQRLRVELEPFISGRATSDEWYGIVDYYAPEAPPEEQAEILVSLMDNPETLLEWVASFISTDG